jgi:hypothetical protein
MISTAYHQQCETLCFAWRNDTPRLRALRFVGAEKRNGFGLISGSVAKGGASPGTLGEALPARGPKSFFEPVRGASDRGLWSRSEGGQKVARRSNHALGIVGARKLVRAPFALHHRSKLALGPASAKARPTSSPRSSIEVCSRTERSSPFAWRSACSGERATLTVTFDSTSGCR